MFISSIAFFVSWQYIAEWPSSELGSGNGESKSVDAYFISLSPNIINRSYNTCHILNALTRQCYIVRHLTQIVSLFAALRGHLPTSSPVDDAHDVQPSPVQPSYWPARRPSASRTVRSRSTLRSAASLSQVDRHADKLPDMWTTYQRCHCAADVTSATRDNTLFNAVERSL